MLLYENFLHPIKSYFLYLMLLNLIQANSLSISAMLFSVALLLEMLVGICSVMPTESTKIIP